MGPGSARDAPPPRLRGLAARRQDACSAVGLGSSTARHRRAAGPGASSLRCSRTAAGRPTRMGPTSTAPGCGLRPSRNPIPAAAPWPVRRALPPSSTSRPALGGHATCHPRRERRTAGPRPGAAWDRRRHQRLSIAGRYRALGSGLGPSRLGLTLVRHCGRMVTSPGFWPPAQPTRTHGHVPRLRASGLADSDSIRLPLTPARTAT